MMLELGEAVAASKDSTFVILTGRNDSFCSGGEWQMLYRSLLH
jgi:enoyl-CoA hydratase/carnithine racemase